VLSRSCSWRVGPTRRKSLGCSFPQVAFSVGSALFSRLSTMYPMLNFSKHILVVVDDNDAIFDHLTFGISANSVIERKTYDTGVGAGEVGRLIALGPGFVPPWTNERRLRTRPFNALTSFRNSSAPSSNFCGIPEN